MSVIIVDSSAFAYMLHRGPESFRSVQDLPLNTAEKVILPFNVFLDVLDNARKVNLLEEMCARLLDLCIELDVDSDESPFRIADPSYVYWLSEVVETMVAGEGQYLSYEILSIAVAKAAKDALEEEHGLRAPDVYLCTLRAEEFSAVGLYPAKWMVSPVAI